MPFTLDDIDIEFYDHLFDGKGGATPERVQQEIEIVEAQGCCGKGCRHCFLLVAQELRAYLKIIEERDK